MTERFTRTILSFLAVLAVYWLYALLVVPRIDPLGDPLHAMTHGRTSIDAFDSEPDIKPTDRFRSLLEPIFAADSWELNQAMVLKNDQFILLVNDYKALSKGVQIELKPCTVVLNPNAIKSDEPGDQCLVLESPDGAVLEFDRPFGVMTGGLGKLVGGRLNGKVSIRSVVPNTNPGQPRVDQLEVITSNVQMSAEQIWTPDLVRFRYGPNYGSGRDLRISLTETETGEIRRLPEETPTHLRSLELVQLDELTVTTGTKSSLTKSSPTEPTTLRVHCQGSLLFDFMGGSVTLQDQVAIQRQNMAANSAQTQVKDDWLTCDMLAMRFHSQAGSGEVDSQEEATEPRRPRWEMPQFELALISAIGGPAVVDAPSYGVRAQAEKIELHLSHNRLLLQDTREAVLQYDSHTFRAPQMTYFVDPQGGPGRAEVKGDGQYVGSLQNNVVQLLWKESLSFGPRDGKYVLDVSGQAHIQWGKNAADLAPGSQSQTSRAPNASSQSGRRSNRPLRNQLTAGHLQLWLRPQQLVDRSRFRPVAHHEAAPDFQLNPPNSTSGIGLQPPLSANGSNPANEESQPKTIVDPSPATSPTRLANPAQTLKNWTPDRLVAKRSVRLRTPQLAGDVEFAEIELRRTDGLRPDGPSLQGPSLNGPTLSSPFGNETQGDPTERYQLAGHEVRIVMQDNGPDSSPQFKSVSIQGGVRLLQTSAKDDVSGLDVQGTKVELTQTETGAVGSIVGQPAIVKTRGVEVSGQSIQVDQGENRVWIDDAGAAYIPLPQNVAARYSRKKATMQVSWQGAMNFDGESVTCDNGVEIRGPAQIATARTLRATLAEPIQFDAAGRVTARRNRKATQPEQVLAQVALTGNVWLKNNSFDDRGLASVDEFRVVSLTYDQSTGQLVGEGPGTMDSRRYTQTKASNQPNQAPQLTHTLIEFQKQLQGSLNKREVSVYDRVRAIHGPIADWKQGIRFDAPSQSPETVIMRATRLTVAQMPGDGGQPSLEFAASGNTEIQGRTFVANSEHVRYAQAKDMLVMEGEGRSVAKLSHQSRIGAPRNTVAARKIQYWIGRNQLDFEDVILGDVTAQSSTPKQARPSISSHPQYAQPQLAQPQFRQPQNPAEPYAQPYAVPINQPNQTRPNQALVNPTYGNPNMLNSTNQPGTRNGIYGRYPQQTVPPNYPQARPPTRP